MPVTVIACRLASCGPCTDERFSGRPRACLRDRQDRCDRRTPAPVGSNAVYRLKAPIIARISRPDADAGHVRRTATVARWQESAGDPAGRAVNAGQPVVTGQQIVTFWEAVPDDGDQYASTAEAAEVLLTLHKLTAPADAAPARTGAVRQRPVADRGQHLAQPAGPGLPHQHAGPDADRLRRA